MTFPEALRELAWLRPEVFPHLPYWFEYVSHHIRIERFPYYPESFTNFLASFTQDRIDETLLELDRRVLLRESVTTVGGKRSVGLIARIFDVNWNPLFTIETDETEKNPAMQKALAAVVEEIKKGEGR